MVAGTATTVGEEAVTRLKAIARGGLTPPKMTSNTKEVAVVVPSTATVALTKPAFTSAVCMAAAVLAGFVLSK